MRTVFAHLPPLERGLLFASACVPARIALAYLVFLLRSHRLVLAAGFSTALVLTSVRALRKPPNAWWSPLGHALFAALGLGLVVAGAGRWTAVVVLADAAFGVGTFARRFR